MFKIKASKTTEFAILTVLSFWGWAAWEVIFRILGMLDISVGLK